MKGWLKTSGPWVLAGLLWAVGIWTRYRHVEPDTHGLIDCAALIATTAAITLAVVRHYAGPRLKPGERIVTDEDYFRLLEAIARGATLAARQDPEDSLSRTHLRSV